MYINNKQPIKICFLICNIAKAGGSERVTSIIASELARKGLEVHILNICGNNKSFYKLDSKVKVDTIYKNKNNVNHKILYFDIVKKIYKYYKRNNIQLSIEVFPSFSLYTLPIKKLLKFKNITWEHFNFMANEGMCKIGRKCACKFSNQIITLTNEDKEQYERNINNIKSKIDYIYNPTPYPNAMKSTLDLKNVITVGRLEYQKGYDLLLEAWKYVERKNNEWKLLIYGDGEDKEKLSNMVKKFELKNVEFKGKTKDIEKCYRNSSIYVSSSRFEGLPMCMIEAQSFGLPIVAFNCKTGPSEIIQNGKNGFLIENENCEELAEKLLILMEDKQKLLNFSSESNVDKFEMNSIIKKWLEIIENI